MYYTGNDVQKIIGCARSKAYQIIKTLRDELDSKGYIAPPAGKIQKTYFCERCKLNLKECESPLKEKGAKI